jgi:Peptidase A4 family
MFSSVARKRQTQPRVWLHLEELESRSLLSSAQGLPILETVQSSNWSGYAAETNLNAPAANAVTMVSGTWTVPTVTGKTNAYSSVWVGIDGYSSSSVEQLGTEQDTTKSGAARYYAWWEMYPNPSIQISSLTISPGDTISASVTYSSGAFTLQITDKTTGKSFSTTQSATAQRSSAEWIVELRPLFPASCRWPTSAL